MDAKMLTGLNAGQEKENKSKDKQLINNELYPSNNFEELDIEKTPKKKSSKEKYKIKDKFQIFNREEEYDFEKDIEEQEEDIVYEERVKKLIFLISPDKLFNSNLNPISQYNYFIEICNLFFNRVNKSKKYYPIPSNCILTNFYDFYVKIIKKFKDSLICLCKCACKCLFKSPNKEQIYESYQENEKDKPKKSYFKNFLSILYLLIAFALFCFLIYMFIYGFIILMFPHVFFTLYSLIGCIYYCYNRKISKGDFIINMVYDENFKDDQMLINFVVIKNLQEIENYKICSFYDQLKKKYTERNKSESFSVQKFAIIGKRFTKLPRGLFFYLIYQIFLAGIFFWIFYFIYIKFGLYHKN